MAKIKRTSIPAKVGISAAIAAFADRRLFRFAENSRYRENEIPAFAGMEGREIVMREFLWD